MPPLLKTDSRRPPQTDAAAQGASASSKLVPSLLAGILVLWGLVNGLRLVTSHPTDTLFPLSPDMSALSCINFVLTGLALLANAHNAWWTCRFTLVVSWIHLLVMVTLPSHPLSHWLLPEHLALTCITWGLLGILILSHKRLPQKYILLYDGLLTLYTLVPLLTLFAYIFDPMAMYEGYGHWVLPVPTALGFLLAFFAVVSHVESKGAAGLLTRQTHYARNFQWLFLLVLLVPLSLGSGLALAVEFEVLRAGFAAAIFCLVCTLFIASVLANNAIVQESWVKKLLATERQNSELRHLMSEVLELSSDAIVLIDAQLRILHSNQGASHLLGWPAEQLAGTDLTSLVTQSHSARLVRILLRFLRSRRLHLAGRPLHIAIEHRDGHRIPVSFTLSKRHRHEARHMVAILRNAQDTATRIHSLEQQIKVDSLTGAGSRADFEHYCRKIARGQRKDEGGIAVLILDIDNFKQINDNYGHPVGDRVLQSFARTTQSCLRNGDRLFRIGGEEFVVIAHQIQPEDAELLADRIRTIIKAKPMASGNPSVFPQGNLFATCSIGVCYANSVAVEDAIQQADTALYEAKRQGKDRVAKRHIDAM